MSAAQPLTSERVIDLTQRWDVLIVGTGVGGATVGHALAREGLSVLFVEKGGGIEAGGDGAEGTTPQERLAQGWWPHPVSQRRADGKCDRFYAAVGCAMGGSSIHYAAALERMAPMDFEALETSRQKLPAWPASFGEFQPFYEAAERLYGVPSGSNAAGEARLSEWDRALMQAMRTNGLKPEILHVAMRYDEQCQECVGKVCPRSCKQDSRTACLKDALRQPRCAIVDQCEVLSLDADAGQVRTVHALHRGQAIELRARVVVLAAGALHSPQVLLRSKNAHWPQGLANRSDQVGRNLMFHTADIYALWAPRRMDRTGRQKKALSIRDFYTHDGQRLGYVQSMGLDAGRGVIASFMKNVLRQYGIRNELLLKLLVVLPSHVAARLLGDASVFAAMTEDDPDPENRIALDPAEPDGASFSYTITDDLRRRADALRALFTRHVKPWRLIRLSPTLSMNYGHPCGTCRFGDDPATSVLDRNCRAHDVANLYVVDASFMPRSGAINPSLTIAANALRVAPRIVQVLAQAEA